MPRERVHAKSFGYTVTSKFLAPPIDDSWDVWEPSVAYFDQVLNDKRHGKWVISWHTSMGQKLILKKGY